MNIVEIHNKEPRAGSKILSIGFGIEERSIAKLIVNYKADFLEFAVYELTFQMSAHGKK
jgi:uncharacterized tellurite resistance protein B-like protein